MNDPKPDSKSKTEVLKPCAICGDLTTRIVQSGGKMIFWCSKHDESLGGPNR